MGRTWEAYRLPTNLKSRYSVSVLFRTVICRLHIVKGKANAMSYLSFLTTKAIIKIGNVKMKL